jgi:hypothetical protein
MRCWVCIETVLGNTMGTDTSAKCRTRLFDVHFPVQ